MSTAVKDTGLPPRPYPCQLPADMTVPPGYVPRSRRRVIAPATLAVPTDDGDPGVVQRLGSTAGLGAGVGGEPGGGRRRARRASVTPDTAQARRLASSRDGGVDPLELERRRNSRSTRSQQVQHRVSDWINPTNGGTHVQIII